MEVELSHKSIKRLADELAVLVAPRVATIVKKKLAEDPALQEWVSTAEAATILGITEKYLRQTKDRYPHIKNGDKAQGNLRFLRSGLLENYAH